MPSVDAAPAEATPAEAAPTDRLAPLAPAIAALAGLPTGIIGAWQRGRVEPALEAMSDEELAAFRALVDGAASVEERSFLLKAAATGCAIADITWFAAEIAGKPADWLLDHCTLDDERMAGVGIEQQYSHACGVTTVETIRGDYDPVYALRLRQSNRDVHSVSDVDATAVNPELAAEQKAMMEATYVGDAAAPHVGKAVNRDEIAQGAGRWVSDWLDSLSGITGLVYDTLKDPPPAEAVAVLGVKVGAGMQTPTVIGNGVGHYAHYVLCLNVRACGTGGGGPGGSDFQFHDPWSGVTAWKTDAEVVSGALHIAGSNMVTALEVPNAKAPASMIHGAVGSGA